MRKLNFKDFCETVDIFGFERIRQNNEEDRAELDNKPLNTFDVDLMIEYLSKLKVGTKSATVNFMNEIQWGDRSGAMRLEVSPSNTFYVKKLGYDLEGNPRWLTKRLFQLNRLGYGGYEESVSQEIYGVVKETASGDLERPVKDWDGLQDMVDGIARQMRLVAKNVFMFENIRRVEKNNYIISFSVRGQGVQARDQMRIEQNCTQISYSESTGAIRATNYKVASSLGQHEWKIMPSDMDCYFFPTQDREEIGEVISTFIKYY